jgi:hypothetical protein
MMNIDAGIAISMRMPAASTANGGFFAPGADGAGFAAVTDGAGTAAERADAGGTDSAGIDAEEPGATGGRDTAEADRAAAETPEADAAGTGIAGAEGAGTARNGDGCNPGVDDGRIAESAATGVAGLAGDERKSGSGGRCPGATSVCVTSQDTRSFTAMSADFIASAVWNRSSGDLASARVNKSSQTDGSSLRKCRTGVGWSYICLVTMAMPLSALNGSCPVSRRYSTTPIA